MKKFTAFVEWDDDPNTNEEIDVEATTWEKALLEAETVLARDYDPGGKIVDLLEWRPDVEIQSWQD